MVLSCRLRLPLALELALGHTLELTLELQALAVLALDELLPLAVVLLLVMLDEAALEEEAPLELLLADALDEEVPDVPLKDWLRDSALASQKELLISKSWQQLPLKQLPFISSSLILFSLASQLPLISARCGMYSQMPSLSLL
jgi:hypothetical protein